MLARCMMTLNAVLPNSVDLNLVRDRLGHIPLIVLTATMLTSIYSKYRIMASNNLIRVRLKMVSRGQWKRLVA
jgi:hypothetical protein